MTDTSIKLTDLQRSLDAYLGAIRIETDGEPQPWASVADPWQRAAIDAIAPAIERLVNERAPEPQVRRCWWVRPRGHSKTADAALLVARVLAFSRRRRRAVWIASDKEQGIEGLDSLAVLCRHNRWLADLLTIRTDRVENSRSGGCVYFASADVSSSYGWANCDLFILDECTHWGPRGEQLWASMFSTFGKRRYAALIAMMNAGFAGTWQERLRNQAESDPTWAFHELPDCVASWIDLDRLRDQQRYLPEQAFNRLWRNRWCSSIGDAIDPDQIDRAFIPDLAPMNGNEPGWSFVLGADLSLTRDFSACVTLAVPSNPQGPAVIRLADAKLWRPPAQGKIDLLEIQEYILRQDEKFGLETVVLDAWQAEHLGQILELTTRHRRRNQPRRRASQPWVETVQPTSGTLRTQGSLLIECFNDDRFRFYDYEPLRTDLLNLRAEQRTGGGFRLTSPRTKETGHGDTASAFMLALPIAHELATKRRVKAGLTVERKGPELPTHRSGFYSASRIKSMLASDPADHAGVEALAAQLKRMARYHFPQGE